MDKWKELSEYVEAAMCTYKNDELQSDLYSKGAQEFALLVLRHINLLNQIEQREKPETKRLRAALNDTLERTVTDTQRQAIEQLEVRLDEMERRFGEHLHSVPCYDNTIIDTSIKTSTPIKGEE